MGVDTIPAAYASLLTVSLLSGHAFAQAPAGMHSGGLAPPPPGSGPPPPPPPQRNPTHQALEEAEHLDSGRGLEFVYFEGGGGAQLAALEAFGSSGVLFPDSETPVLGPVVNVASGVRLLYLTIGPRFRFGHYGAWDLWTLNLDLGWRIPLGRFEPYAFIGGGFAKVAYAASVSTARGDEGNLSVSASGFDIRLGGGADYYVSNVFSVGGTLGADVVRLSRSADDGALAAPPEAYTPEASTWGIAVTAGALLGLHF
jgi:hypothetical protein